jgi:hypothetical protein
MGRSVVQHWLLNLAIEVPCSLGTIFPSVEEEYLNVKKIAGCKPEEYGESLLELFEEGLIILKSDFAGDNVDNKDGVAQIVERFVRLPKDAREVRYASRKVNSDSARKTPERARFEVTKAGGEEWERRAEPDWNHYFDQRGDQSDCEVVSQNRDLVMAVLGWFPELGGGRVDVNSIQIQKLDDYPIFYWKYLPSVFKANFAFNKADPRLSGDGPAWPREPEWFHEWQASTTSWYRKPWEMPEWPSE